MDSSVSTALPTDHPMMKAWNDFQETDEFKNALRWAIETKYDDGRIIDDIQREQHAKGSMWLAFTKALERALEAEEVLRNLMQHMSQTCDEEERINGVIIEEAHTESMRFHHAWLRAAELLDPPAHPYPPTTDN